MVLKYLRDGAGADLRNLADNFGADNDLIAVLYQGTSYDYDIYTMAGADLIDLQDAHADNEHAVYSGAGRDSIYGGDGDENIYDQSGNDLYILRGGDEVYASGTGNDTANGGGGADSIYFVWVHDDAGGFTYNTSGITCDLARTGVQDFGIFGQDRISGFEHVFGGNGADRLFGTSGANTMTGNDGNDLLNGRGGADTLYGGQGNNNLTGGGGADFLYGEDGNDLLVGRGGSDYLFSNNGNDRLTGGGGADVFELFNMVATSDMVLYTRISDSGTGLSPASIDEIRNFDSGGSTTDDQINLNAIDARPGVAGNQAFIFRGTGAFTSPAGEVRLVESAAGDTLVQVDIDGDGASEMNILVQGVIGLTASDFIL